MTVLLPTRSGIAADQESVPVAVPAPPVEVVHCTEETATLSLAVPLTAMVAEEAEAIEEPGETIVRVGGTVSGPAAVPVPVAPVPVVPVVPVPVVGGVLVTGGTTVTGGATFTGGTLLNAGPYRA